MQKQRIARLSLLVLTGLGGALAMTSAPQPSQQARRAGTSDDADGSLIIYIANEGVVLEGGGKRVVIDGMFRHLAGYPRPSDATRADIENARGTFADVDLVLATHYHGDHFDAMSVGAHLAANRRARFVAVRQVTETLAKGYTGYARIAGQVMEVTLGEGKAIELTAAGLPLKVLRLRHGNTMNAGFLLEVGGKKVLHVGDADGDVANFDPFDLQKAGIDFALVPYWYALDEESRGVIREHIAPKQVIFFHIPEDNPDDDYLRKHMQEVGGRAGLVARIKKDFPPAMFLLTPDAPPTASYRR